MCQPTEERKAYQAKWYQTHREEVKARFVQYCLEHLGEMKAYYARYRLEHKEERNTYQAQYYQTHRGEKKEYDTQYRLEHRADKSEYDAKYRQEHTEKLKNQVRAWRAANPLKLRAKNARREAIKKGASIGSVDLEAIMIRDKMTCGICGKKAKRSELHFDHIIPLSKGGAHAGYNLQVAHATCNMRKHTGRLPSQVRLPF